jgi:non-specific protein-tyrosine kinase
MELTQYIRLVRRWFWLILLLALIAGGLSYLVNMNQPLVYQASTTISIGRYINAPNPNSGEIRTGIELAQTYAEIVRTYDVLQGTIDALNLPVNVTQLNQMFNVELISGTSLMVITAFHTDPNLAADIANELATQLIIKSPTNLTPEQLQQVAFANSQIEALNEQIEDARAHLDEINAQILATQNSEEITRLSLEKNILVEQINSASATVAEFTSTIVSLQQRTNSLEIVDQARLPTIASQAQPLRAALLGGAVGAVLAFGLALLIEYLDNTIRTTEDAAQTLGLPVLGAITKFGKKNDSYPSRLISLQPSLSPIAEGYRTIRTNLLFASENHVSTGVYVLTSPGPEEGKSVSAANIAISMAHAGLQVLLIDADLRRPRVHELFGLENTVGLTTLLFADPSALDSKLDESIAENNLPQNLKQCFQKTSVKGLRVITTGFTPANPTELLGSVLMQRWIATFRASPNIDVVIFDTPPTLVVADASVLAANIKSDVVLVVDRGHTRRGAALKAKEQLVQLGINVKGVIVNRVNAREESEYGYDYGYYYAPIDPKVADKSKAN